MGKGKKGGKRMNKAQLTEMLQEFFAERPGETLSFKEIFRSLRLTTHPLKMLAIDIMEEMAWDDYLAKVSDNSYRLNQSIQVMEGKFVRKANGKNSVIPDDSEKPIFVSERNSMGHLMATGWNSPSWLVVRITSRRHRSTKSLNALKIPS